MDSSTGESVPFFLTDLLAHDHDKGKKKSDWDTRKGYSVRVADLLANGERQHQRLGKRVGGCANVLFFGWEDALTFKGAWFCRVRTCPVCQWRRSQMLLARFFQALPAIREANPTLRYLFLTLTVKNCPVGDLRATVQAMNKAWNRLASRRTFPAVGFVRSLEVTKETDTHDKKTKKLVRKARPAYAHPHFHILLAVEPSYFAGKNYLSTEKWAQMWQDALRADYTPVCDVRIVKPNKGHSGDAGGDLEAMKAAIVEVVKYTVKPSDIAEDGDFLLALVDQLHKLRAVSLGGVFKDYLAEAEEEGEGEANEAGESGEGGGLAFGWRDSVRRYQHIVHK